MRRVALIYNPVSGQHPKKRAALAEALAVLREAGVEAEALATTAPGSAGMQALEAARQGCDTILACGGDGTVHEILQSLVGTPVALGVVPMGTANALAADLGLSLSPAKAVRTLLSATPVRVSVGQIFYHDSAGGQHARYFTVTAGIGADAHLMYRLDARLKRRFGYALYMVEALRIWASHSFPLFETTMVERESHARKVEEVSQLLAVRIRDFGGMLHNLAPGAALNNNHLRLVAFKTRSRLRYLQFMAEVLCGRQTHSSKVELLDAVSVECRALNGSPARVFAEADGEFLGTLPVRIEMAPEALTLLIPPLAQR
jgi:YegS/Rv2252/BmrU family lipid kinase